MNVVLVAYLITHALTRVSSHKYYTMQRYWNTFALRKGINISGQHVRKGKGST